MSTALQKSDPQTAAIVPIKDNAALMTAIAQAATDPNVDVDKMERLFAMHERMEARQAEQAFSDRAARQEAILQHSWRMWGWPGPHPGGLCDIDIPIPDTPEGGGLYCYTEQARLIEQQADGRWLAEIEMPGDWFKNGRQVLLERQWIGPPRRVLSAEREAREAA